MAKFPSPPGVATLKEIDPDIRTLDKGTTVYRIFRSRSRHKLHWNTFRYFGPTSARYDHHLPDDEGESQIGDRGILYGAVGDLAIQTCLAEVYQSARTIDRDTEAPVLCAFSTTQPLHLLDLSGAFTTKIGASMAINTGPRPRARLWAQQLYEAYDRCHGIYYSSSMYGNQPAIALFERASFALPQHTDFHRLLADPDLDDMVISTADDIGYFVDDPKLLKP